MKKTYEVKSLADAIKLATKIRKYLCTNEFITMSGVVKKKSSLIFQAWDKDDDVKCYEINIKQSH